MKTQNSTTADLYKSIREFLLELRTIGYKKMLLRKAIRKLKQNPEWATQIQKALHYVKHTVSN